MRILLPINKNIFSLPVLISYSFIILAVSVIPVDLARKEYFLFSDKLLHIFSYLLLALVATNLFFLRTKPHPGLKGFFYSFTLGLLIEGIQYFLPFRAFELPDLAANFLGSLIGSRLKVA